MTTSINQKRIAVISGANGYLGFEIAKKLAHDGMSIAMLCRSDTGNDVALLLAELNGQGHHMYFVDIIDRDVVRSTLDTIEKEMGPIFACIHSAGTKPQRKALLSLLPEELEEAFRVNVQGGFNFLSLCGKRLQAHKEGVIIGITTAGVVFPEATHSLGGYIPAKYALQGMLTMLKEELKKNGVRVYSVAPGFMEGGMNSDIPKAFIEIFRRKSKTQTLTTPEDVAKKIVYLCSEEARSNDVLTHVVAKEY